MASEDYNSLNVAALKDALRERGLTLTGKKNDLVKRLEDHDVEKKTAGGDGSTPAGADEAETAATERSTEPETAATGAEVEAGTADEPVQDDVVAKRIERFGSSVLGEEEKAKLREARFNAVDPVADASKIEARAARFGIETEEAKKQKELARAKRFQMETPEILAEKKRAREARFSQPVPEKEQVPLSELEALIVKRT